MGSSALLISALAVVACLHSVAASLLVQSKLPTLRTSLFLQGKPTEAAAACLTLLASVVVGFSGRQRLSLEHTRQR